MSANLRPSPRQRIAVCWFAGVAVLAVVAIAAGAAAQMLHDPFRMGAAWAAGANSFAFWTMQSNVLVALAAIGLARGGAETGRAGRTLRLVALTAITLTGVIFNTLLGGRPGEGLQALHSNLAHVATPLLFVGGWLAFGRGGGFAWRDLPVAMAFPALWATLTLARGAAGGWYPYWFVDADQLGWPKVAANVAAIGAMYLVVAGAFVWLDGHARR